MFRLSITQSEGRFIEENMAIRFTSERETEKITFVDRSAADNRGETADEDYEHQQISPSQSVFLNFAIHLEHP